MNLDLFGKNALVCGASKGIGKAAAIELASLGANVTIVARNEDNLKQALNDLPSKDGQTHSLLVIDLTDHERLMDQAKKLADKKTVHILVNNTGGPAPGPAHLSDPGLYLQAFNQHLISNQILAQTFIQGMQIAGYGRIINIISTSVKQPLDGLGVSNTIRGAVANWAKTLANELGPKGITVNNVLPGATATDRLEQIIQKKATKSGLSPEEIETKMKSAIPVGRFGKPFEIGSAVAFLASPSAAYINGTNLVVDGGRTKSL